MGIGNGRGWTLLPGGASLLGVVSRSIRFLCFIIWADNIIFSCFFTFFDQLREAVSVLSVCFQVCGQWFGMHTAILCQD